MNVLTRRRSRDAQQERWHIYFGDVRVGSVGIRAGVPIDVDQWGWNCGFYPGVEPAGHQDGTARSFKAARRDFMAAWRSLLPKLTDADFDAWRAQRDWTARKYAMWERGEKMPSQIPSSLMRCACGDTFDSHRLADNLVHIPHITAAQAADGIRR
jgi:hypothetical protein